MTQLSPIFPETVTRAPRSLLARVAESAFWMSRYVERAEHVARVLLVNANSLLDVGDIDPLVERQFWAGPLRIFLLDQSDAAAAILDSPREQLASRVGRFLALDEANPNSILSCITRARENARSIRENISAEMFEGLNTLYWSLRGDDAPARFEESSADALKAVTNASMLFQGLSDQTLNHGQIWRFIQLGRFIERIDVTCRIIETKLDTLRAVEEQIETPERNMHLLSIVRSCCALEAYRRRNAGEIDPDRIAAFLILERNFPRAIAYCARNAHEAIGQIRLETRPSAPDRAEAVLGRLQADLQYTQPHEVAGDALHGHLQKIQASTFEAAVAVRKSYFLQ
jgi:uncharacterized alpha-E superfamily protein